jgi:hypothetical protein
MPRVPLAVMSIEKTEKSRAGEGAPTDTIGP